MRSASNTVATSVRPSGRNDTSRGNPPTTDVLDNLSDASSTGVMPASLPAPAALNRSGNATHTCIPSERTVMPTGLVPIAKLA